MFVHKLQLKDYRNLKDIDIELGRGINILWGDNGQGKTSFLESIYFCGAGRSQRTKNERELINFHKDKAYLQLSIGDEQRENYYDKISMMLNRNNAKAIAVNGVTIKKTSELLGTLLCVIFSPMDLDLVKAGPQERRRFMDIELCQLSKMYCHELSQYHHVLKQRNNLLRKIRLNTMDKDCLFVWDEQLYAHGSKIIDYRLGFIEKVNKIASEIHYKITNTKEVLQISYKPNVLSIDFINKLNKNYDSDVITGNTSVGIHKDDLLFTINGIDIRSYGSQGQQRTASLAAKLAEIQLIKEKKNNVPVLLLDDVMSELDESRQRYLISILDGIQTIITCTGVEDIIKKITSKVTIYNVENGKITKCD